MTTSSKLTTVLLLSLFLSYSVSQQCADCPRNAATCTYDPVKNKITIQSCNKGYTIDAVNTRCVLTCKAAQYYDYEGDACNPCPSNAATCT